MKKRTDAVEIEIASIDVAASTTGQQWKGTHSSVRNPQFWLLVWNSSVLDCFQVKTNNGVHSRRLL
jgi:hypothetical protein